MSALCDWGPRNDWNGFNKKNLPFKYTMDDGMHGVLGSTFGTSTSTRVQQYIVYKCTKDKLISQLSKKRIFFFISFTNLKLYTRLHESSTGKVPPVDRSSLLIWCCCFYFVFFWGRGFFRVDGQKIVVLWISQNVVHKKNNTVHSKMNWFIHTKVVSLSFGFWTCSNVIFVVDHL